MCRPLQDFLRQIIWEKVFAPDAGLDEALGLVPDLGKFQSRLPTLAAGHAKSVQSTIEVNQICLGQDLESVLVRVLMDQELQVSLVGQCRRKSLLGVCLRLQQMLRNIREAFLKLAGGTILRQLTLGKSEMDIRHHATPQNRPVGVKMSTGSPPVYGKVFHPEEP